MKFHPPRRAVRFLRWFCREDYVEEIEGDLTEMYQKIYPTSPSRANWTFIWNVIKYLRPEFTKTFRFNYTNPTVMFRHNLLITFRSFLRYWSSFAINLIGLSTGLACVLLIYLWVHDEYSVDKFHEKDARLFQIIKTSLNVDHTIETHETTPGLLAQSLADEIPEVEYAVGIVTESLGILSNERIHMKAKPLFVGKDFFNTFSYRMIEGNRDQALSDKYGIIITDDLALKLFRTTRNLLGKMLTWDGGDLVGEYKITGVVESPPGNSSMQFDVLFPFTLYYDTFKDRYGLANWNSNNPSTYLVLKPGVDVTQFNEKIKDFARLKYQAAHGSVDQWEGVIFVQKYSDKYLYNRYDANGKRSGGRIEYVRIFSLIAVFILIIACINFMNLSTAKASRRTKEVGIKKAIGAARNTLIAQYLSESMVMSFLSLSVALLLVWILLPQFNLITAKHLTLNFNSGLMLALAGVMLFTGILAGSYPAFYLSGFSPVAVLKGGLDSFRRGLGEALARKGLVIFQFTLSIILIVSVLVVYNQIEYIQAKNLGYDKNNVILFSAEGKLRQNLGTFLTEVKNIPGVINASGMDGNLTGDHSGGGGISWPGQLPGQGIEFDGLNVGYDLANTLDIRIKVGRFFSPDFSNETEKVLFNQAAIDAMNLKDPLGQIVTMWGKEREIIGIVEDFHFESLYKKVGPFFFRLEENTSNVVIKIKPGTESETLQQLDKFYQAYNLGLPFDYHFLDEDFQRLYSSEQRVVTLTKYFACVAILISCLGLFGLAAFTAERRIKEIGIRKVLGSSRFGIIYLLSADFTRMVIAAITIALPVSYILSKYWLDGFAYHIGLELWYFAVAALAALSVAWLTVGMQTLKAASVNPTQCLRND